MHLHLTHLLGYIFLRFRLRGLDKGAQLRNLSDHLEDGIKFHNLLKTTLVRIGLLFFLSNDQNLRKVVLILKVPLIEMNLTLINHTNSLMVIMCHLELNHGCVGLPYDRNDKVHEHHKQEEV